MATDTSRAVIPVFVGAILCALPLSAIAALSLERAPFEIGAAPSIRIADLAPPRAYLPARPGRYHRHAPSTRYWQPWPPRYCNTFPEWAHLQRRYAEPIPARATIIRFVPIRPVVAIAAGEFRLS